MKELDVHVKVVGNGYLVSVLGEAQQSDGYSIFGPRETRNQKQMVFSDPFEMCGWLAQFFMSQMPKNQAEALQKKIDEEHGADAVSYTIAAINKDELLKLLSGDKFK